MTTHFEPINRLKATVGKWDLTTPERPIYQAPQPGYDKLFGICVSGIHFVEGEARVTVKIPQFKKDSDASGRFLMGYRAPAADYLLVGLGGGSSHIRFTNMTVGLDGTQLCCAAMLIILFLTSHITFLFTSKGSD